MCGRYKDTRSWDDYRRDLEAVSLPLRAPDAPLNLAARQEIRPTEDAVIVRPHDGGVEIARLRWWLVPWFHKGNLKDWKLTSFNAKCETVQTSRTYRDSFARRRCLVGADGWWEWNGPKADRRRWWIAPRDGKPIMFGGFWDRCQTADRGLVESFTIITQPPGPLSDVHDRAPVVLFAEDWRRWLDASADVMDLMGQGPADRFHFQPFEPGQLIARQ